MINIVKQNTKKNLFFFLEMFINCKYLLRSRVQSVKKNNCFLEIGITFTISWRCCSKIVKKFWTILKSTKRKRKTKKKQESRSKILRLFTYHHKYLVCCSKRNKVCNKIIIFHKEK